jgi:hypothetical protein
VQAGQHYLLKVDGANFEMGTTEPKMGSLGTIFAWTPVPGQPAKSFTLIVELGANLPGPTVHVMATANNSYAAANLANSRIRFWQSNGNQTSREVLGIQAL